jgi:hypothetical protein
MTMKTGLHFMGIMKIILIKIDGKRPIRIVQNLKNILLSKKYQNCRKEKREKYRLRIKHQ